ncbi:MAG TPA: response regulator [Bryobacteraceae bacterium]|nr:response regulator [Bryobacteraceae bacterium]
MSSAPSQPSGNGATTILAVDDDRAILNLLAQILQTSGYQVITADSGWGALRAYEEYNGTIHLLITDVIMPDLTGPVLAQRLRLQQPDLQVIFVSGFHDADLVQRFVAQQGFTLLPKPFSIEGLLRVVQMALQPAQA